MPELRRVRSRGSSAQAGELEAAHRDIGGRDSLPVLRHRRGESRGQIRCERVERGRGDRRTGYNRLTRAVDEKRTAAVVANFSSPLFCDSLRGNPASNCCASCRISI